MSNQFLVLLLSEMNKYLTSADQKEFHSNVKKRHLRINCLYRKEDSGLMIRGKKDIVDIFKLPFLLLANVFYLFLGPLKPDLRSALI